MTKIHTPPTPLKKTITADPSEDKKDGKKKVEVLIVSSLENQTSRGKALREGLGEVVAS